MSFLFVAKTVLAALVISFASWLSGKRPDLAGFIVALPLTTLLALAFSYSEYRDAQSGIAFARSIFVGIPVSLLFFAPFLLAQKLRLEFWSCYALGLALLVAGYFIHRFILSQI